LSLKELKRLETAFLEVFSTRAVQALVDRFGVIVVRELSFP
jgi:hypothetical protein